DQWIALSIRNDSEWQRLLQLIDPPDRLLRGELETAAARRESHDEIDDVITSWASTLDKLQAFHLLQPHGIPAGPVLTEAEVATDPQLEARGFFSMLDHPSAGAHPHPGPNFQMSETPLQMWRAAPRIGEDNEYVYRQLLGVDEASYAKLVEQGHIGN